MVSASLRSKNIMTWCIVCGIIATFIIIERCIYFYNINKRDQKLMSDLDGSLAAGIVVIIATLAAIVVGIIGLIKSSGARKEAKEAGEKQIFATIGLITSIVGTVESAIVFFSCGLCIACVACAAASSV